MRTPGAASAPSGERCACGVGRQARDAGVEVKASVPPSASNAVPITAAAGDSDATSSATISGPATQPSVWSTDSSAYAVGSCVSSSTTAGHSARIALDTIGNPAPHTAEHATSVHDGRPASALATTPARAPANSVAAGTRTRGWPKRSTSRPWSGEPTPSTSPNAAAHRPATVASCVVARTSRTIAV